MKVILIPTLMITLAACSIVRPGERGVRITLGSVSSDPKPPGAYIWVPFIVGMAKIDVQVQKSEIETGAASKDMQDITTKIAINWKLDPAKAVETYINVGDEYEILHRIIDPAVSEVLKAATAQHTAEDILNKRLELKRDIDDGLKARLAAYGITLFDVSIVHLSFTAGFEKAVEDKQIAEQRAKEAAYEAQRAIQDAKATVERARGQSAAQALLKDTITANILQQEAIKKWDGTLPTVMLGNSTPMINLSGAIKQ